MNPISLAIGFLGVGLVCFVWIRTKGWFFAFPRSNPRRFLHPPSDLCAPAVSLLESRTVGIGTVLSTVVEMYQRGILVIEAYENKAYNKNFFLYYISQGEPTNLPWEQLIYDGIDKRYLLSTVRLDQYKDQIGTLLGQHLFERGFFEENPVNAYRDAADERNRLKHLGILGSVLVGFSAVLSLFSISSLEIGLKPALAIAIGFGLFFGGKYLLWLFIQYVGKIRPSEAGWKQGCSTLIT